MKIIKQSCELLQMTSAPLELIERAGRTCYQSESKGDPLEFYQMVLGRGHESVVEHAVASVRFITDRGVTHEMVRHRLASYSQESTRYCNYSKGKFGGEITVVLPVEFYEVHARVCRGDGIPALELGSQYRDWLLAMESCEKQYLHMLSCSATPQLARSVLPNSLKTSIVMTANFREWRHFFKLRTAAAAHPQMRDLALQAHDLFPKWL